MNYKTYLSFDSVPVPLLSFDKKSQTILGVNQSFKNILPSASDFEGEKMEIYFTPVKSSDLNHENNNYYLINSPSDKKLLVELVVNDSLQENRDFQVAAVQFVFPALQSGPTLINQPIFKSAYNKGSDIIFISNDQEELLEVNQTACEKLKFSRNELLSMSVKDILFLPETSSPDRKASVGAVAAGDEFQLQNKSGDILYVEYRGVPNICKGQHLWIFKDVTEQKKIESYDWLLTRALVSADTCFICLDEDLHITYFNNICTGKWLTSDSEQLMGKKFSQCFEEPRQINKVKTSLEKQNRWNGKLLLKNGEQTSTEADISIEAIPGGNKIYSWLALIKSAESKVQSSEKEKSNRKVQYNHLLEAVPDGVFIVDQAGVIQICNNNGCSMFGYKKKELIGEPVERLMPDAIKKKHVSYREKYVKHPTTRPMNSGLDLIALRKDGTTFPVDIMLGPYKDDEELKYLAIVRDTTKFKEAREKLRQENEFIELINRISSVANHSNSLNHVLQFSIKEICEFMEWPAGHVYLPSEQNNEIFESAGIWHLPDTEQFEAFKVLTETTSFTSGEGMIGSVIETGEACWVESPQSEDFFKRKFESLDLGICSCFAFPILIGNKVYGVMEFFSDKTLPENKQLLERMATIGTQIARVYERHINEKSIRENAELFSQLFQNSPISLVMLDPREKVQSINKSFTETFGYKQDQIKGNYIDSFFVPEEEKKHSEILAYLAYEGESSQIESKRIHKNGVEVPVMVGASPVVVDGKTVAIFGMYVDLREQKEIEHAYQITERNLKEAQRIAKIGSWELNNETGIITWSDEVYRIFESDKETFGGTYEEFLNLVHPEDREKVDQTFLNSIKEKKNYKITHRLLLENHQIKYVQEQGEHFFKNEEWVRSIGTVQDVTEQVITQKKLQNSLEEKEVLLAEVHHRVKNNLAIISGLLQLEAFELQDVTSKRFLTDSVMRIKSMALIHDQLYSSGNFSDIPFKKIIEDLASMTKNLLSAQKLIDFNYSIDDVQLNVNQAIPTALIINELLTNAYKHAFEGVEQGEVNIRLKFENGFVALTVKDNGIGLPKNFDTKNSKSLGYTLIKKLSKQLGGKFKFTVDNGTRFDLKFRKKDVKGAGSNLLI